jgi:hypothetical protein
LAVFVWPVTSVLLVFGIPSVNARMAKMSWQEQMGRVFADRAVQIR